MFFVLRNQDTMQRKYHKGTHSNGTIRFKPTYSSATNPRLQNKTKYATNRDTVMYEQGIITNRRLKNSKGKLSKNSFDKIETDY